MLPSSVSECFRPSLTIGHLRVPYAHLQAQLALGLRQLTLHRQTLRGLRGVCLLQ